MLNLQQNFEIIKKNGFLCRKLKKMRKPLSHFGYLEKSNILINIRHSLNEIDNRNGFPFNSFFLRFSLFSVISLLFALPVSAQKFGVSTNFLYWSTATPNAAVEVRVAPHISVSGGIGYNAVKLPASFGSLEPESYPKLYHLAVTPEMKYWLCRTFERGYIDFHAVYSRYNAGGIRYIPMLKDHRYDGWAVGGGIGYGYQWPLGRWFGIEASVSAGYIYFHHDKYDCGQCGRRLGEYSRNYWGITKATVSLIYYIR